MQRISIILPLYKSEKYIRETLDSVLAQTYPHWELVVIDDGSPDRSGDLCRAVGDERIRVYTRQNTGSCRSRNFGIGQSRGELIAFIDHDDLWSPTKLERHVDHLEKNPDVGVSYGPSALIDAEGRPMGLFQVPKLTGVDAREVLCRNPIGNGSVPLIRKLVFEETKFEVERDGRPEVMYFDDESVGWEDVELWIRMALQTAWRFEGIPDCLTLYRIVEDGIAGNPGKKQAGFERGLERARRYAPAFIAEHEAAARAYHLRYLARRLIKAGDGKGARAYAHRALRSFPGIVREEPGRTLVTLAAAYALEALPPVAYQAAQNAAIKLAGALQSARVKSS